MARSVASDRFVKVALRGAEQAVQRAFVAAAHRALDRAVDDSQPTEITRFVDSVKGRPLEQVKPFGVVHWRFGYLGRIASAALTLLRETSPVDEGEYQREHVVFLDGVPVTDLANLGEARRVVVSNAVPYARVIERGMHGQVPWSKQPQVPRQGVYRAAARALRRTFGHLADIDFTFVAIDHDAELGDTAPPRSTRFPAIAVEAR